MWLPPPWLSILAPVVIGGGSVMLWGMFHPRSQIMGPLLFRAPPSPSPPLPPPSSFSFPTVSLAGRGPGCVDL